MLRQWLNEDRIDDPKKMITNSDIEYWLGIIDRETFRLDKEYHISECCKAELFFKGAGKGFWCSNCKKEITRTIVAFNDNQKVL